MNEPNLEQRLDRLERENRRSKCAGTLGLAVAAVVVLMGQETGSNLTRSNVRL